MGNQVGSGLLVKHSPDQISRKLVLLGMSVSHESIYGYVSVDRKGGGNLWRSLRINIARRYLWRNKEGRREKMRNRVDIKKRSLEVSVRSRYEDWELDLIQDAEGSGSLRR